MPKYKIFAGSINGAQEIDIVKCKDAIEASKIAYDEAVADYESYEGLHGLRALEDIMDEDDIEDEEAAWEIYRDERESWLEYYAELVEE